MRRVQIGRGDFSLFHQDISPLNYEFFRTHSAAFKRMWQEQRRSFWSILIDTYDDFIWTHGVMKDFPLKIEDKRMYISEIISVLRSHFVDGTASTAKSLIMDCVVLVQNRHHVSGLDKGSYSTNPFYMKETREVFRKLFGPPKSKATFIKLLCGIPVYVKFAGAAINLLRRWLTATEIGDEYLEQKYLDELSKIKSFPDKIGELTQQDKDREEVQDILDNFDPELEAMINELAPNGHQKMIFKQGPDDPAPRILGLSNGPMELINKRSADTYTHSITFEKKKKKKSKSSMKSKSSKKPVVSHNADHGAHKLSVSPVQDPTKGFKDDDLLDLRNDPNYTVHKIECESDLVMPDGRIMKSPFTFICGKGEKPDPALIKASWDKYKKEDDMKRAGVQDNVIIEEVVEPEEAINNTKVKLHKCGNCDTMELEAKTFKRCVKCRGRSNPKYYCSKSCQVADWKKGHRLEHKDDKGGTAAEEDITG